MLPGWSAIPPSSVSYFGAQLSRDLPIEADILPDSAG